MTDDPDVPRLDEARQRLVRRFGHEVEPWLRSQDLQGFEAAPTVDVRPVRVETIFARDASGAGLSYHDGYLVRYQITWSPTETDQTPPSFEMTPTASKKFGVKMAWRP